MSSETKCETCGGDELACVDCTAERAELEAWERHCPECLHYESGYCYHFNHCGGPDQEIKVSFDTCPLRPKNVPSQDGHDETEEV